ncbi:MAG: hypothetical protein JXA72_02760 [Bacteroidales bacterium]|nr:hypothetical protein [Bacteroidales bacterium]
MVKGFFAKTASRLFLMIVWFMAAQLHVEAQQNNTLFFMHSLPEANYVNPAVQLDCGIFIGLPLISSFHMNIANSGFTPASMFTLYTDGSFERKHNFNTAKLANHNYFIGEFHSTLFALGIRRNRDYYSFTITEKNNTAFLYTADLVAFTLRGSEEFEGNTIGIQGTRMMMNHYREFAFGIARKRSTNLTVGAKVKILFGEFNLNTGNSALNIYVENSTRELTFDFDGGFNSSLPVALREETPGAYRFQEVYDAPLLKHLMNFRNPGLAFDAGFIYKYNDRLVLSGSLLDLGLIYYRSNLTNYRLEGTHAYNGPFGQGSVDEDYLLDVFDEMNQNMNEEVTANPYVQYLDPRMYLGAAYQLNNRYDLNFLLYNRLLPGKLQTGATVSLLTRADKRLRTSVSWSYMNNSITNLGLGVAYGKRPVQLYLVSDNILGFILPFYVKNVNLRAGINLKLSCRETFDINQCGCEWIRKEEKRRSRNEKFRRGK